MPTKKEVSTELNIPSLRQGVLSLRIVGTEPLYQNRMAAKAKHELLVGGVKRARLIARTSSTIR